MSEPAVKGSIFTGVMDDLAPLRASGRVGDAELEARLSPEELDLIDGEINPAAWYPVALYDKLLHVLCDADGDGKDEYFELRGRRTAKRLMDAGLYQQLAFLSRWGENIEKGDLDDAGILKKYRSQLKMVGSLAASIYNTGRWEIEIDPDEPGRVCIVVYEARHYSDAMIIAIEGFLNACASAARKDLTHLHKVDRPSPNRFRFRMTLDVADIYV